MENSELNPDEEDRAVRGLRREVMMLLLWAPSLGVLLPESIQEICDGRHLCAPCELLYLWLIGSAYSALSHAGYEDSPILPDQQGHHVSAWMSCGTLLELECSADHHFIPRLVDDLFCYSSWSDNHHLLLS